MADEIRIPKENTDLGVRREHVIRKPNDPRNLEVKELPEKHNKKMRNKHPREKVIHPKRGKEYLIASSAEGTPVDEVEEVAPDIGEETPDEE